MDLKALIAKMDHIESKRFLTEDEDRIPAKKKDTSWTDKSGKKHPATQVQGHQSRKADKEADKESKRKDEGYTFKSDIANTLLREFGLGEATPPFPNPAAGAGQDSARAQYDQFKADDAKAAAVKQIQAMLKPNGQGVERLQNAIDPKTGIIYYGEEGGEGGIVTPKQTPFNFFKKGQQPEFVKMLKSAGLEIKPIDQKTLFGTTQVAAVDPKALATLGQAPAAAAPAAAPAAAAPAAAPAAAAPATAAAPGVKVDPDDLDAQDAEMGKAMQAMAAGTDTLKKPSQSANPPAGASQLDPAKLKRFQELLDKVKAGDNLQGGKIGGGAATPSPGGPMQPLPPAGGSTTPAAGGSTTPAAGGSTTPAAGGSTTPAAAGGAAGGGADGPTGQALAKLGVTKQNRLDQAFVDKTLGAGKYKAGSAESNLALLAHFKKQGGNQQATTPGQGANPPKPSGKPPRELPGVNPDAGQISSIIAPESLSHDDYLLKLIARM